MRDRHTREEADAKRQYCHGTGTGTWDSPGQDSPGHVSYFLCPGHIWDNL